MRDDANTPVRDDSPKAAPSDPWTAPDTWTCFAVGCGRVYTPRVGGPLTLCPEHEAEAARAAALRSREDSGPEIGAIEVVGEQAEAAQTGAWAGDPIEAGQRAAALGGRWLRLGALLVLVFLVALMVCALACGSAPKSKPPAPPPADPVGCAAANLESARVCMHAKTEGAIPCADATAAAVRACLPAEASETTGEQTSGATTGDESTEPVPYPCGLHVCAHWVQVRP